MANTQQSTILPTKRENQHVFADTKEKHPMRYTLYRGFTQVTNWAIFSTIIRTNAPT